MYDEKIPKNNIGTLRVGKELCEASNIYMYRIGRCNSASPAQCSIFPLPLNSLNNVSENVKYVLRIEYYLKV